MTAMNAVMTRAGFDGAVSELVERPEAQSVEEDLFVLNAMSPSLIEHVPVLFEETVKESLSYLLGAKESARVLGWFRGNELASRQGVFDRLTTLYGNRASPLESVIDRVFGMRVHELVRQLP